MVEERGRDRKREGGGREKRMRQRVNKKERLGERTKMERERRKESVGLRALKKVGKQQECVCQGNKKKKELRDIQRVPLDNYIKTKMTDFYNY